MEKTARFRYESTHSMGEILFVEGEFSQENYNHFAKVVGGIYTLSATRESIDSLDYPLIYSTISFITRPLERLNSKGEIYSDKREKLKEDLTMLLEAMNFELAA